MNSDLEDAHLCIKCKSTILGLENYIAHRKNDCNTINVAKTNNEKIDGKISNTTTATTTTTTATATATIEFDAHAYDALVCESKNRKTLDASYDLATELGADVFFSSLQLQSVESLAPHKSINSYQRQKSLLSAQDQTEHADWIDTTFKSIEYTEHLPECSESSAQEEESEDELPHIPPTVPATHTGGKWKPEHRPGYALRVSPYVQELSPAWDYNLAEEETYLPDIDDQSQHPPAEHTRGKWVPGSKMQLEYKECKQIKQSNEEYWCKICARKLKGKINYEAHLKTNYHLKRAQPEQELEKAELDELHLHADILNQILPEHQSSSSGLPVKRKRRKMYIKCELCRLAVQRHLIGKHLISHYHYRRMQTPAGKSYKSLAMILEHIHSIVLQSPFQCRACCFYANSEEAFLQHWKTAQHLENCVGAGQFYCNFCQFQCNSNDIMYKHLIGLEHKEVLLAINRSVPISISKILHIKCSNCHKSFRYNIELRKHLELCHRNALENESTASDLYQCIHKCELCLESFRSKISLQRHEKNKHNLAKYFCFLCNIQFDTALQAKRHRKTLSHRETRIFCETQQVMEKQRISRKNKFSKENHCKICQKVFENSIALSLHIDAEHPLLGHVCPVCGKSFAVSQALGQHTRYCRVENATQTRKIDISEKPSNELVKDLRSWRCQECDYSCAYESELIFHSIFHFYGSVSREQKIKCPLCDKTFCKESLRCHLRLHTKEKMFVCEFCGAQFTRRHHLKTHTKKLHAEKSHHGIAALKQQEKHKFNENLAKEFSNDAQRKNQITIHQQTSTGQQLRSHSRRHLRGAQKRIHSCDKCEFKSSIKGHFERHRRMHTGEKPYQCPHCKFCCASLDNLRRHILNTKLHPGHFIYECKMCANDATEQTHKFKTNFYNEYQQHLRNVHHVKDTVHFMQNLTNK